MIFQVIGKSSAKYRDGKEREWQDESAEYMTICKDAKKIIDETKQ